MNPVGFPIQVRATQYYYPKGSGFDKVINIGDKYLGQRFDNNLIYISEKQAYYPEYLFISLYSEEFTNKLDDLLK